MSDPFCLGGEVVHVWTLDLSKAPPNGGDGENWLCAEELASSQRMGNVIVKQRFMRTRAGLRWLLGLYLDRHPTEVVFETGAHGKPRLAGTTDGSGLSFNVSHCGDLAMLAFAFDRRLGVDVEAMRPQRDLSTLAERVLAAEELAAWRRLDERKRVESFYRWWVCKEAFGKAVGLGIQVGFKSCVVEPDQPKLLRLPAEHGAPSGWQLIMLDMGSLYAAAVCYQGASATLRRADLTACWEHESAFSEFMQMR